MIIPLLAGSLLALFAPAPGEPAARLGLEAPSDPEAIVGGLEAESCQWPTAVAILEDDPTPVMCTGSLVHPNVVVTAAHCISPERPIVAVSLGEQGLPAGLPQRIVPTIECVGNPLYYSDVGADVGYCLLAEPVNDVPIVPLLAGCETDAVYGGVEVVIVGFGATWGTYDQDGNLETMGVGTKRWTTQTVDFIDAFFEEINLYGPNGSQSACFGDSGGPALVQLGDGTWRVLGTGGHLYDPGGLPPPMIPDNYCGAGAAYGYIPFVLDWLEQASGHDLTPCWDGDVWDPGPDCADFPIEPDLVGSWNASCSGGAVGGALPPACAELPPPGGTDSGGSESDDGDTWGMSLDIGGGWGGSTTGDPGGGWTTSSPDPRPPDEPPPWTSDTDAGPFTSTTTPDDDPGLDDGALVERGCACTASPRPWSASPWLVLLPLLGLARRRSRAISRSSDPTAARGSAGSRPRGRTPSTCRRPAG